MKTVLKVTGMKCAGCEVTVQTAVQECEGVIEVKANHRDNTVEIQYDETKANLDTIRQVIGSKGFQVA